MLAYDSGSIKKNDIYEELIGILKDAGKTVSEFSDIIPNSTYTKVQEGAALVEKKRLISFWLLVGWVIDCCKIIAAQTMMDEGLWEMEMERHQLLSVQPISMGAIVTMARGWLSFTMSHTKRR